MRARDPAENFMRHIEHDPNGGCWLWTASMLFDTGYGQFNLRGQLLPASRAAWVIFKGPIPDGMFVLHRCDVRACANPGHLFLGTHADNMADMTSKGRSGSLRGSAHPSSRLNEARVVEIRWALAAGATQRATATAFGVTAGTIQAIHEGRTWRSAAAGYHFDAQQGAGSEGESLPAGAVAA